MHKASARSAKLAYPLQRHLPTIKLFKTRFRGALPCAPPPPICSENPMGLMGFEDSVEFASRHRGTSWSPCSRRMGFSPGGASHRSRDVVLYRQGRDRLHRQNREPKSVAGYFAAEHGPCACGMAFRGAGFPPGLRPRAGAGCPTPSTLRPRPHGAAPAGHRASVAARRCIA